MFQESLNLLKEYRLLVEDLQSSKNQALKMLKTNNIENAENVVEQLSNMLNDVENSIQPEFKKYNTDSNIPYLALLFLGNGDINMVKNDYENYLKVPSLLTKNHLKKIFDETINYIKSKKLFQNSDEKTSLFQKVSREFHETCNQELDRLPKKEDGKKKEDVSNVKANSDTVFENSEIVVYLADSPQKTKLYGQGSNLCISGSSYVSYYYQYRLGIYRNDGLGMTTYFVYWKKEKGKRILIDALGDENGGNGEFSWNTVVPNSDNDISKEQLIQKFPDLKDPFSKNIFKFLPYNEKEQKAFDIYTNVNSISELKTEEDMLMFVGVGKNINDDDWKTIPTSFQKKIFLNYIELNENILLPIKMFSLLSNSEFKRYVEKNPNCLIHASKGNLEIVQELLKHPEILVNGKDDYGDTALNHASNDGNLEIVQELLKRPEILVNEKDNYGDTALIHASRRGNLEIVQELLKHPEILVNEKDNYDNTALIYASKRGKLEIVEMLKSFIKNPEKWRKEHSSKKETVQKESFEDPFQRLLKKYNIS